MLERGHSGVALRLAAANQAIWQLTSMGSISMQRNALMP